MSLPVSEDTVIAVERQWDEMARAATIEPGKYARAAFIRSLIEASDEARGLQAVPDIPAMLEEFHTAAQDTDTDALSDPTIAKLRAKLIEEESLEAIDAILTNTDRAHIAKELGDLVYVAFGAARVYRIPLMAAVAEVHKSNMTKVVGGAYRRVDGKLMKGKNFVEADMEKVLTDA
jgi:NTP pyrophosphatase (non-canonical NTP hydrolase)